MKLYNTDLPELKAENAEKIIKTCRDIHQQAVDRRTRNTEIQKWDKYWVNAYNVVLEVLKNKRQNNEKTI